MTPSRPPDVAFLPQPGVLRAYAREHLLVPLDAGVLGAVDENYDPLWRRLGSVGRRLYGVWFKAANKSLIWYNEGVFERSGGHGRSSGIARARGSGGRRLREAGWAAMNPVREIERHALRAALRSCGAAVTAALVATGTLAGCAWTQDPVPRCGDPQRMAIIAQSVPTASYVPCARHLPQGWRISGFGPARGGTRFLLESDRAPGRPVTVQLRPRCAVAGASPTTRRADGVLTYIQPASISPSYAGNLFDVFPGGCVIYSFNFKQRPHIRVDGRLRERYRSLRTAAAPAGSKGEAWRGARPMKIVTEDAARKTCARPHPRPVESQRPPARLPLAGPGFRLGLGTVGVLLSALPVRADRVGRRETQVFRTVNNLPDSLYLPVWPIMQLGTLGAAPAAAGAAWLAGDRRLAWRLAAGGTATWAVAKLVKRKVRRPRPPSLITGARCRGPEASGLGYLSGHAGVATALGTAAFQRLSPPGRALTLGIVPMVGLSRAYVGAHLPLDIVGGAALGLAIEGAVTLAQRAVLRQPTRDHTPSPPERPDQLTCGVSSQIPAGEAASGRAASPSRS